MEVTQHVHGAEDFETKGIARFYAETVPAVDYKGREFQKLVRYKNANTGGIWPAKG